VYFVFIYRMFCGKCVSKKVPLDTTIECFNG